MPFPPKLLNKDESVVLDLRPHWWAITPASVLLAAALIVGLVALTGDPPEALQWIAGLLVLGALGYFVSKYITWISENFVITNERVIYRSGVVAKKGIEIPLDRINTVFFNQSIFERALGAGDVAIESAAETGRQVFNNVRKPHLVQQEIYRQMEGNEQRDHDKAAAATAAAMAAHQGTAAPQELSIPDQIAKLDELRRQGVLSDDEFETKKRQLLDRM